MELAFRPARRGAAAALSLGVLLALASARPARAGRPAEDGGAGFCTATAQAQHGACRSAVKEAGFAARAVCANLAEEAARAACLDRAREERREAAEACREQRDARRALCAALGEARYEPDFDPAHFQTDFGSPAAPNSYFPLAIGSTWEYAGAEERITVEVRDATKLVEGVPCLVVNDLVEVGEDVAEDTDDWFALRDDGTVVYCGEISRNFERFPGDDPPEPELVDVEGSWKAGRDGAKAGTLFPGAPQVGQVYRQEWAPGVAEDAARVLSTSYGFGSDAALDELVPQALADALCAGDCVVTAEFSPLEPDAFERKYYAPGIGLFLEVSPEDHEVVRLVGCDVDPRCATLPAP